MGKSTKLEEYCRKSENIPEMLGKAPDCVVETVIKRMEELDKEIKNYQDMVTRLEAEYAAHANFLMSYQYQSPFEQRNLSQHGSVNIVESPQP